MTVTEQLKMWVEGNPVHNSDRDECCPDFSCCNPKMLAPEEARRRFAAADEEGRYSMLMMFLGSAAAESDKRVAIARGAKEQR